ncbi:fumarylacetoacetate hydrolase family protein [Granulicella sp. L60]|uniref:fumarylacetoacetate hydrolase family protein n=1 Tax=Granulicella sp. L60 TaxID=1641866 RepID=UPI00131E5F4F|nr:fumarylacetoacetate hydrolase family protein [Granulicella sp. L60]
MRLVTYSHNSKIFAGLLSASFRHIFPLDNLGYGGALAFVVAGEKAWKNASEWANMVSTREMVARSEVALLPPLPRPGKFLCIGANYRDRASEVGLNRTAVPEIFTKFPSAIVGHGANVIIPSMTKQPDYEAELAIVIGKTCKRVAAKDWQEYVFGYTIVNDISARDPELANSPWNKGKNFDTFAPVGPAIVCKNEIPDPHVLNISLAIDGVVMQNSNTRRLIFKIPELIAYLSNSITLEPGDIISTGTPAGCGFRHNPQRWLRHGDTVTIKIEGIGSLRNKFLSESLGGEHADLQTSNKREEHGRGVSHARRSRARSRGLLRDRRDFVAETEI